MPRVLRGSWGHGRFLMSEVPLYLAYKKLPPRRTLSRRSQETTRTSVQPEQIPHDIYCLCQGKSFREVYSTKRVTPAPHL
jgi:hypothetical protein